MLAADARLGATTGWAVWNRRVSGRLLLSWGPDIVHGQSLMLSSLPLHALDAGPSLVTVHSNPQQASDAWRRRRPEDRSIRWRSSSIGTYARLGKTSTAWSSPTPDWSIHFDDPSRASSTFRTSHQKNPPPLRPRPGSRSVSRVRGRRSTSDQELRTTLGGRVAHPHAKLDLVGWLPPAPTVPGIALPVDVVSSYAIALASASHVPGAGRCLQVRGRFQLRSSTRAAIGTPAAGSRGLLPRCSAEPASRLVPANDTLALADALRGRLAGRGRDRCVCGGGPSAGFSPAGRRSSPHTNVSTRSCAAPEATRSPVLRLSISPRPFLVEPGTQRGTVTPAPLPAPTSRGPTRRRPNGDQPSRKEPRARTRAALRNCESSIGVRPEDRRSRAPRTTNVPRRN